MSNMEVSVNQRRASMQLSLLVAEEFVNLLLGELWLVQPQVFQYIPVHYHGSLVQPGATSVVSAPDLGLILARFARLWAI